MGRYGEMWEMWGDVAPESLRGQTPLSRASYVECTAANAAGSARARSGPPQTMNQQATVAAQIQDHPLRTASAPIG